MISGSNGSGWTNERVAHLKEMWIAGLSAGQIARKLGGVSRCAVIGKAHRVGLKEEGGRQKASLPPRAIRPVPKAPRPQTWSPEALATLKRLYPAGSDLDQISAATGMSEKAIVNKVRRMRLIREVRAVYRTKAHGPAAASKPKPKVRLHLAGNDAVFVEPEARPAREVVPERIEAAGSCTVLSIAAHQCKWPIGDPADPAFTMCGHRIVRGAYCEGHARRAYQTERPRKRSLSDHYEGLARRFR